MLSNSSNSDVLVPFKNSVHSARYCAPSCMVGMNLNFKLTKDKTSFLEKKSIFGHSSFYRTSILILSGGKVVDKLFAADKLSVGIDQSWPLLVWRE